MTLLLNLVGPSGIHQSSDYRLTDIASRRPIEDAFGSKQLDITLASWSAQVSFTGLAEVGRTKTRDWISQVIQETNSPVPEVMARLASRATNELRAIPPEFRELTIVVTIIERGRPNRLVVVSRERPVGPRIASAPDEFGVYEFFSDTPQVFILGYITAVTTGERRLLKALNRGRLDPAEIRRVLSQINARAARKSNGFVSEGCLVTSVLPNGHSASENFGRTPGVPAHMVGSPAISELIDKSFPGKKATFVQGRGVRGGGVKELTTPPMNVSEGNTLIVKVQADKTPVFLTDATGNTFTMMPGPLPLDDTEEENTFEKELGVAIGEPRRIRFSSPTGTASIIAPDASPLGSITIDGVVGELTVRKNQLVRTVLNTITVQMDQTLKYEGEPFSALISIMSIPTVDGVQPSSWTYSIDAHIKGRTCSLLIRRNSLAFRSVNYKETMPALTSSEELALFAPRGLPLIKVSEDSPTASVNIEARWLLRDIRQPT